MKHVVARVVETHSCPLYRAGDSLLFAPPVVRCDSGAPVCALAVHELARPLRRIFKGRDPTRVGRRSCGGCGQANRALFEFRSYVLPEEPRPLPVEPQAIAKLKRSMIFAPYPEDKLALALSLFEEVHLEPAQVVISQGTPAPGIFVLQEGAVEVIRQDSEGKEQLLATLEAGDCFGEMSIISGQPATATVRALGPARALMAPREAMGKLYAVLPDLPLLLARLLAARLASISAQFIHSQGSAMKGRLDQIAPLDLVQFLAISRMTGTLAFELQGRHGRLTFRDGRLMHGELELWTGEEAVHQFVGWTDGYWEFTAGDPGPARTIDRDTTSVLLEALRRHDQLDHEVSVRVVGRRRSHAPPPARP